MHEKFHWSIEKSDSSDALEGVRVLPVTEKTYLFRVPYYGFYI